MKPLRLVSPVNECLVVVAVYTALWAKAANCPTEASEVQTPNTPLLRPARLPSHDHNSQLRQHHSHKRDSSPNPEIPEPGKRLALNSRHIQ